MNARRILTVFFSAVLCFSGAAAQHVKTYGYYFLENTKYRQGLFNPDDIIQEYGEINNRAQLNLSMYAEMGYRLGNVYAQADVLARARGMESWNTDTAFPQVFIDVDWGSLVVTAGRAIHRWGTGYAYSPTDVIAPAKDVSDPENSQRTARGNDMVKAEYFGASWSAGVCLLGSVEQDDGLRVKRPRAAFRLYKTLGKADLSCIALISAEEKPVWGVNGVTVLGDRLELHGECAWYGGSRRQFHRALYEEFRLYEKAPFARPPESNNIHADWLAGFQYTLSPNALVIGEWLHHDGMSCSQWERFTWYGTWLREQRRGPCSQSAEYNLMWCAQAYSQGGAMRDYIMATFQYTLRDRFHFRATMFVNAEDSGYTAMPYLSYTLKNTLSLYVRGFIFNGPRNSEFGEFFQSFSIEGGIQVL